MPRGPNGGRRTADVVGCAVQVARISGGVVDEEPRVTTGRVRSGQAGGVARKESLSPERRHEIAKKAASSRWA